MPKPSGTHGGEAQRQYLAGRMRLDCPRLTRFAWAGACPVEQAPTPTLPENAPRDVPPGIVLAEGAADECIDCEP